MKILHTLPLAAQEGIIESLTPDDQQRYGVHPHLLVGAAQQQAQQRTRRPSGPVLPSNHQGELPSEQVAQLPNAGWQGQERPAGSHRMQPRDPGQGGA